MHTHYLQVYLESNKLEIGLNSCYFKTTYLYLTWTDFCYPIPRFHKLYEHTLEFKTFLKLMVTCAYVRSIHLVYLFEADHNQHNALINLIASFSN